jgi:hypothetical protein
MRAEGTFSTFWIGRLHCGRGAVTARMYIYTLWRKVQYYKGKASDTIGPACLDQHASMPKDLGH